MSNIIFPREQGNREDIMHHSVKILFFFNGQTRSIEVFLENLPQDKSEAEAAAWGAVRTWFEQNCTQKPEFVRNVRFEDVEEYSWDILPVPSSSELLGL